VDFKIQKKLECGAKSIAIYESFINRLQKFTDRYLGQASFASRDVPIEKISTNTKFKLSFTSPSIEELASSFRTDGHQSIFAGGF
jgi:hypothetical protein